MSDKKFGLIIPKKADKFKLQVNSVFGDESDEDEKQSNRPKIPQKKSQFKSKVKQETLEDPSIYEYDSIYDEMKAKEAESIAPKEKKNSRYIETLLKAADKRKKEYEKRIDKKIQAERENEGDMYKDKEAFVTSSYKKKLEEKEEEEERERRENMLNDMMDISKQKDLSGFYRHFLKQTVGEEKVPVFGAKNIKKQSRENSPEKARDDNDARKQEQTNIDQDSDGIEIDSESDESDSKFKKSTSSEDINRKKYDGKDENLGRKTNRSHDSDDKSNQRKKHKTYHRRANSTSSSESLSSGGDDDDDDKNFVSSKKSPHSSRKPKSHTSRDDSSDSEKVSKSCQKEKKKEFSKKDKSMNTSANTKSSKNINYSSSSDSEFSVKHETLNKRSSNSDKKAHKNRSRHDSSSSNVDHKEKESQELTKEEEDPKKNKSKKNIYTKRTVGEIFISAQAKYFQRMALKT